MAAGIDLSDYLWPDVGQGRQPQGLAQPALDSDLLSAAEFLFLGSQPNLNILNTPGLSRNGPVRTVITPVGIASQFNTANSLQFPTVCNSGGWTIAGIIGISGSFYNDFTLIGVNNGAGPSPSGSQDRGIGLFGTWRGGIYNGGTVYADSGVTPVVGRFDKIVVTSSPQALTICVNGVIVSTSWYNTGDTGYSNPYFVVNRGTQTQTNSIVTPLLLKTRGAWTNAQIASFMSNPWQVLAPPQRLLFATSTTAITSRPNRFPFALGIYNQ